MEIAIVPDYMRMTAGRLRTILSLRDRRIARLEEELAHERQLAQSRTQLTAELRQRDKEIAKLQKALENAQVRLKPRKTREPVVRRNTNAAIDRLLAPAWQREQLASGGMIR